MTLTRNLAENLSESHLKENQYHFLQQNGYEVDTRFSGARVCVSLFQTETKRTTVILFKTKSRTSWSGSGKTKVFEKTPSLGLAKNKLSVVGCE